VINLMVRTARAASQELNFHPPFVAGTPRHVPGGSALEYSTSALDAVTSPAGAGAPVAPREDFETMPTVSILDRGTNGGGRYDEAACPNATA